MGNLKDGALVYDDLKYLPSVHPDIAATVLAEGDVLFNRTNSREHVGKTAVFHKREGPVSFASYLIRLRTNAACRPAWLSLALNSPHGRQEIQPHISQQVGQANVNGTKLASLEIPLPPRSQQEQLLEAVAGRDLAARRLAATISGTLVRESALRRSILKAAFEGRLTSAARDAQSLDDLQEAIA